MMQKMMQKKMISYCLSLFFILMSIAGCASFSSRESSSVDSDANANVIFVAPAIATRMKNADRDKLQTLVATAQAQQTVEWKNAVTGEWLEFTSLGIYVNEQGQGCRNYRLLLKRRLFAHPSSSNYTACRDNHGIWQVTTQ